MYSDFFAILDFLAPAPRTRKELYEHFGVSEYRRTRASLAELLARGLISRKPSRPDTRDVFSLTIKGYEQLEAERKHRTEQAQRQRDKEAAEAKRLEERREDHADAERRYTTQNKIAIVMPLVTFFLGLLVEHFFQIIGFAFSVLHLS